jgi:hypothetical protein
VIGWHDDKYRVIRLFVCCNGSCTNGGCGVSGDRLEQDLPIRTGLSQGFGHQEAMVLIADGNDGAGVCDGPGAVKCEIEQMTAIHQRSELLGRQLAR